jgi:hypothetical protein
VPHAGATADYYAVLGEERRPWLDTESLRGRFLQASADVHPDRFHAAGEAERLEAGRRYAELNTAHITLREPRTRLAHLLHLERGEPPRDIQRTPPGTMDLFVQVGQVCRQVDVFLAERRAVTSPLLKVRFFQQGLEWVERLKALQGQVSEWGSRLDSELRLMNAAWAEAPEVGSPERRGRLPLDRLEEVYRAVSYGARWTEQIQERLVELATG